MAAPAKVRNNPNFAVICSFLHRYGEHLRLPDLTIPELEEVLEKTDYVGHGLKELIITLMKRVVSSIKPDRWEKHLIRLVDNYHSASEAWELESLGFSLCKLETKLDILKYLCETQFDDNHRFKNLVNKESPNEQNIKPVGRDKFGLVYWFQKDHDCNIRIYREEQDDRDSTTWCTIGRGRDDLANLITELTVTQSLKLNPLDSLESSRSVTPILTNGETAKTVKLQPGLDGNVTAKKDTENVSNGGVGQVENKDGVKEDVVGDEIKEQGEAGTITKSEAVVKNGEITSECRDSVQSEKAKCEIKSTSESEKRCSVKEECNDLVEDSGANPKDAKVEASSEDELKEKVEEEVVKNCAKVDDNCDERDALTIDESREVEGNVTGTGLLEGRGIVKTDIDEDVENKVGKEAGGLVGEIQEDTCKQNNYIHTLSEDKTVGKEDSASITGQKTEDKTTGKEESASIAGQKTEGKWEAEDKQQVIDDKRREEKGEEEVDDKAKESQEEMECNDKETEGGKKIEVCQEKDEEEEDTQENKKTTAKENDPQTVKKKKDVKSNRKSTAGKKSNQDEANEMGWSRRRLRVRKLPPKEEPPAVVEDKSKKKTKEDKKNDVKSDNKSEESADETNEESEDDSDEEFTLKQVQERMAAGEAVPPVKMARTASKKDTKPEEEELSDEPCSKCGNYTHPSQILLCDTCDEGYHTACLRPPLMFIPDGEWFCPPCEHMKLLQNLRCTLEVVDDELKVVQKKYKKKPEKFRCLLTEICPANILPEDSSVIVTKRIEAPPERPRHERTQPARRQVQRNYIEETDEFEYIQRRSGRNRKQISYKFEEYDSAINSAIHDELEEKRKADEFKPEKVVVYGQSRGKDMSTIEAARWEDEELEKKEKMARKRKKRFKDLDASSEEEAAQESDGFQVTKESCSDDEFVADDDEASATEESEVMVQLSGSDSGSEYGSRRKKGVRKKQKIRARSRDMGAIRRSSRNLGRERKIYQDTSSESEQERPRNAWRVNPMITARQRVRIYDGSSNDEDTNKQPRGWNNGKSSGSGEEDSNYGGTKRSLSPSSRKEKRGGKKRRKQEDAPSSTSEEEENEDGYVQPKRKFRIDSDDDSEEGQKDRPGDGKAKKGDGDNSNDDEEDDDERLRKKRQVSKYLRGIKSRVDYRKMADGSSSGEDGERNDKRNSDVGEDSERNDKRNSDVDEDSEGGRNSDGISDGFEDPSPPAGKVDDDDVAIKGSEHRVTDAISEDEEEEQIKTITAGRGSNASDKLNNCSLPKDDDESLSPISDAEETKKKDGSSEKKMMSKPKTEKRSAEDDDDLEGVTDIFDYLSKD